MRATRKCRVGSQARKTLTSSVESSMKRATSRTTLLDGVRRSHFHLGCSWWAGSFVSLVPVLVLGLHSHISNWFADFAIPIVGWFLLATLLPAFVVPEWRRNGDREGADTQED